MTQRLAAYLDGALDVVERARMEAELDRDPALRAQLDALCRADAALQSLSPAQPPAGYEDRLHARIDAELDDLLAVPSNVTDLSTRRRTAWLPALAGAAAVVVLLAVVGTGLQLMRGGAGQDAATEDLIQTMDAPAAPEADEDAVAGDAPMGPTVADFDRDLDSEGAGLLLSAATTSADPVRGLELGAGAGVSRAYAQALGARAPAAASAERDGQVEPQVAIEFLGTAGPQNLEDIGPCLETLLEPDSPAIPVMAEMLVFEGEPAVAYGLLSPGPDQRAFDRVEVWIVSRSDCSLLHFVQQ